MNETPQQYIRRMLAYQRGRPLIPVLSSTPRKIASLLKGIPVKRLRVRPQPARWSVTEILAHLADAEMVFGFRMRLILGSNGTPIQAFDQDSWAVFSRYADQDPSLSLESFRVQRQRNVVLLKLLTRKMWGYHGIHTERGKETITRMTRMLAGHDINHVRQIERIILEMKK